MRRGMKWGAGAAVVGGLAWLLSGLFNLNGPGAGGDGDGDELVGIPSTNPTQVSVPESTAPEADAPSENSAVPSSTAKDATVATGGQPDGKVVEVMVQDREYAVRRKAGNTTRWVPADAATIAALAKQAAGEDSGVKVRVYRRPNARAAAEEKLLVTLRDAGLTEREIDVPLGLVE